MELSIYLDKIILIYCVVLAFIIGAVFGSFLNCAAYRIAHKQSFLKGRSHCTTCGHVLGIIDLIPLAGWLVRGGKCAYCGEKISVRYPLTELFFALQAVFCLLKFDLTPLCLRNFVFACCLFTLSLIDLEIMEIPDGTLLIAAAAWIVYLPFSGWGIGTILSYVGCGFTFGAALLLLSLLMDKLLHRESMGGGDIKLFALTGLYLGWVASLLAVLLACILGLLFAGVRQRSDRKSGEDAAGETRDKAGESFNENHGENTATATSEEADIIGSKPFPFGPAIAAAAWCVMLIGGPIVNWYLGLIGL